MAENAVVAMPDRRLYIGGSDAAAVLGLSPWATPVELWMEKTGRRPHQAPDAAAAKRFARGHKLEPFIREMVIDKLVESGLGVELVACNARYYDPEHPFMSCEIDFELALTGEVEIGGRTYQLNGEHINADAKSVSGFARKKWGEVDTEDVPIEYAAQFMFGLMLTGRRLCLVAALRSFDDVDIYWTVRDDETIAAMRPKLVDFWVNHVLAGVAPDPFKFSDIKALFALDNGQAVEATPEIVAKVAKLRDVRNQLANLAVADEVLAFDIARFISPNARLTWDGRDLMTFKGQSTNRVDIDALKAKQAAIHAQYLRSSNTRVLRFAPLKKGSTR